VRVHGLRDHSQVGQHRDREAGLAQPGRAAARHEDRRFAPGDHHPADAVGDDEVGARHRAGRPRRARLQRAVQVRLRELLGGHARLRRAGQRHLFGVIGRVELSRITLPQDPAVRADQERADRERGFRRLALRRQLDGLQQPVPIRLDGRWLGHEELPGLAVL
jgi:hypothetical protein